MLGVLGARRLVAAGGVVGLTRLYTLILSGPSAAIGIGLVNLIQPGTRLSRGTGDASSKQRLRD